MLNHYVPTVFSDLHIGSAASGLHKFMPLKVSQVTEHHAMYKNSEQYVELELHLLENSTLNGGEW
jgi:hypothetical protein